MPGTRRAKTDDGKQDGTCQIRKARVACPGTLRFPLNVYRAEKKAGVVFSSEERSPNTDEEHRDQDINDGVCVLAPQLEVRCDRLGSPEHSEIRRLER